MLIYAEDFFWPKKPTGNDDVASMQKRIQIFLLIMCAVATMTTAAIFPRAAFAFTPAGDPIDTEEAFSEMDEQALGLSTQDSLYIPSTKSMKIMQTSSVFHLPVAREDYKGISTYFSSFHPGVDIRAKLYSKIHPVQYGKVIEIGYERGGYGKYIVIEHESGLQSLYAHLAEVQVKLGDEVKEDSTLGLVGLTGHTTGPHIHFEFHAQGKSVNPKKLISFDQEIAKL